MREGGTEGGREGGRQAEREKLREEGWEQVVRGWGGRERGRR